ncbi:MAG: hypothetical protein JWP68_1212 [Modestobacter sp.]|jgi:hypothetical protein|nr:hypothetical protein [Modestobacter sp.]
MQQVYSEAQVNFGQAGVPMQWNWGGGNVVPVPRFHAVEIGAITLNFFPAAGGSLGRCDAAGRDATGTAVWRVQIVYVEPQKTTHLPFPVPLRVEGGGHVELSFTSEGPGSLFVSMNGHLV